MKAIDFIKSFGRKPIKVNGNSVWDYKDVNGELRLISEHIQGSESFENVTASELIECYGTQLENMVVVDESTGEEINL